MRGGGRGVNIPDMIIKVSLRNSAYPAAVLGADCADFGNRAGGIYTEVVQRPPTIAYRCPRPRGPLTIRRPSYS